MDKKRHRRKPDHGAANDHSDKQAINRFGFFSGRFESGLLFTAANEDERDQGKKTSQDWHSSHVCLRDFGTERREE